VLSSILHLLSSILSDLRLPAGGAEHPPGDALRVIGGEKGDHFRDVARRYAKEGYVALVPDVFSRHGGTAKVNPQGTGVRNYFELAPVEAVTEDTDAGFTYLKSLPEVRGDRLGLTAFCWGGDMAFRAATQVRGLRALVVFYGRTPSPEDLLQQIEAPVLAHHGELDKGITGRVPQSEAAMKKYNKPYEYKIYAGAQHAFFHDGRPGSLSS